MFGMSELIGLGKRNNGISMCVFALLAGCIALTVAADVTTVT